jgi:aspartate kinase
LEKFGSIEVDANQTIVCIVGHKIEGHQGILERVFGALNQVPIRMVSVGGSANNISLLIPSEYKKQALTALNKQLFGLD